MPDLHRTLISLSILLAALLAAVVARAQQMSEAKERLLLNGRVLLDARGDGFMSVHQIRRAPNGDRFAVIACGYECTDNLGFLFRADGSGKRKFTGPWDSILQDKLEWSADGRKLYYFRINSTGADSPVSAPREGWVEVDVASLRKRPATTRALKPGVVYGVFNVTTGDQLNVRSAPGTKGRIVGALDRAATGVTITGSAHSVGAQRWVPIKARTASGHELTGWVNQSYLYEVSDQ